MYWVAHANETNKYFNLEKTFIFVCLQITTQYKNGLMEIALIIKGNIKILQRTKIAGVK